LAAAEWNIVWFPPRTAPPDVCACACTACAYVCVCVCVQCPKCGSTRVLPNLRGGDWFIHRPYEATQARLLRWMDDCLQKKLTVAILEVGVGANTPVVTRLPASAFASALAASGGAATYLRVNPDTPEPASNERRQRNGVMQQLNGWGSWYHQLRHTYRGHAWGGAYVWRSA